MAAVPRSLVLACVVAGLAMIACLSWWISRPASALPGVEPFPPLIFPEAKVPAPIAAAVTGAQPASNATRAEFPSTGLAARVDGWARDGDPRDAFKAYEAVRQCLQARAQDRTPVDELERDDPTLLAVVGEERMRLIRERRHHAEQWCGDLRSDQVESRNQWLARATAASVPGATGYFIAEGPDGMGLLRQGPQVKGTDAWYAQRDVYIAHALQHCDRGVPDILAATARAPEVPLLIALSYWTGKLQCDPAASTQPSILDDPQAAAWLMHMGRGEPMPPFNGVEPDAH